MTYSAINAKKQELIRKSLAGSFYIGDYSVPAMTALTDEDGDLLTLPTGMVDGGHFTQEGLRFGRAVEQSEIQSHGSNQATRTDVTGDTETIQVDFQETNRTTIALSTGLARTALTLDADSSELKIPKPTVANPRYYRGLALSVDGPEEAEIYIARYYPRLAVTDFADQAYAKGSELRWGCSFRAEKDSVAGSPLIYFFGGPGWKAICTQMGFTLPA